MCVLPLSATDDAPHPEEIQALASYWVRYGPSSLRLPAGRDSKRSTQNVMLF